MQKRQVSVNQPVVTDPVVVTPVQTEPENPIDTSDWKTYRNERYGYSIQYPKKWYVDTRFSEKSFSQRGPKEDVDLIGGDTLFSNYQDAYGFNLGNRPSDIEEINLMVFKVDPNITYDQFKYGHVEGDEKKSFVEISGETAYKIERVNTDHPVGVKVVTTFLKRGEHMFLLTYSYDPQANQVQNDALSVYEKAVESFRLVH